MDCVKALGSDSGEIAIGWYHLHLLRGAWDLFRGASSGSGGGSSSGSTICICLGRRITHLDLYLGPVPEI